MSRRDSLTALLYAHAPSDAVERQHQVRMLELIQGAEDPFARERYQPGHFTASAFVLAPERDALLLIHHRKLERWLQPGGHFEPEDSDVISAARREALEEVGLSRLELARPGPLDLDVHHIPARPNEAAHEHFDVRFLFVAGSRELVLNAESKAARWVALDELATAGSDASVARAASKIRASS